MTLELIRPALEDVSSRDAEKKRPAPANREAGRRIGLNRREKLRSSRERSVFLPDHLPGRRRLLPKNV